MNIFLRLLVGELKQLWSCGLCTKQIATCTFFNMKVMFLWTINFFLARSSLSGWSGKGYKAFPTYNEDTLSYRLTK